MVATSAHHDVWQAHYASPAGFRYWPCEELVRSLAGRVFGTAVDVGCGNGANLWLLAEHARQVVGVDPCEAARDAAEAYVERRGCREQVVVVPGDARALPIGSGSACALVDVMTSQHLPWASHAGAFREYRRVLRRGGWCFVYHLADGTTVTGGSPEASHGFDWARVPLFREAGPTCLPTDAALVQGMAEAGFAVSPSRAMTRRYADGRQAVYLVMEGEAV